MGRNNSDFSAGLFHGSDHEFNEGDMVNPGKDGDAWASTNKSVAAGYGANVYAVEHQGDAVRFPGALKKFGIHSSRTGYKVIKKVSN